MDGDCFKKIQLNERANGVDRISELPDEILCVILSFLPVRKAASTTVLSSRWLGLWKQIPNLKFNLESDRISQLPDQVMVAILSLLTVKQVVATSVLSSRWSDLWKHSPCLDFDYRDWNKPDSNGLRDEEYIEIVNSVIRSHKALSLKQFRISFPIKNSAKSVVAKWLEFVFLRQVESLELDFLILSNLKKLVFEESLREMSIICGAPQTLFFCQSLKSLFLKSLIVGGEDVELFLRNCPLLEKLKFQCVHLTSDINVCGATLMLKHLVIIGCSGEKSLRVSAPNLSSLTIRGTTWKLVFEYVPKLIKADLRSSRSEFFAQQITQISQVQILKLCLLCPKVHYGNMFSHMPNLKKLFLYRHMKISHGLLPVTDLIWASPRLEEFTFRVSYDNNSSASMEDITSVERSLHQHLKVVELQMYSQEETDNLVELVAYLSDNCVALREIIIRRGDLDRYEEFEADFEYLEQQLQGKVRGQIQLRLDFIPFLSDWVH